MSPADDRSSPDRIREVIRSIGIPVGIAAITVLSGTVGYFLYLPTLAAYEDASTLQVVSEAFFRSLGFLVLNLGAFTTEDSLVFTVLTLGRAAGTLFAFYAALAGVGLVFAEQLRPLRVEAWSRLGRLPGVDDQGHVIVCGIGDNGYAVATEALNDGRNVVAIDTGRDDRTANLEAMGAIAFEGDASHEDLLAQRARLHNAADVFVTTGSDATNGAIVETIDRLCSDGNWPQVIDVTARIDDHRLRRTLHQETTTTEGLHLRTYDVPEATARELLATTPIDDIDDIDERVHVWLVGWTPFTEALLHQLLHLMHYPDAVDRQVTVVSDTPTDAERSIAARSPGIDPEWWDDREMSEFVGELFPDIDVRSLPSSDMELLSDRTQLYDTLQNRDRLTIFADDTDAHPIRSTVSSWGPKLDELAREFDLDAHLAYRGQADANWSPSLSVVSTSSYTAFGDGCSIRSVRGEERDRSARQFALVYHVLYEDTPAAVLPGRESVPIGPDGDFDAAIEWLSSLPPDERDQYGMAVWRDLPEYQRDSNRHAADHAAVKHRMARLLEGDSGDATPETIRALAESEHRRWCAEKIVYGWEPLPDEKSERWETPSGEQELRDQRYHPDIRSVESLREEMDGEWDKDLSQVRTLLKHPDLTGR